MGILVNYFDEFDAIEIFYQLTVNQSRQLKFRGSLFYSFR